MNSPYPELSADIAGPLQTGTILGENHAFAIVSGRCSAAQAEALFRLRESKSYLRLAKSWKEFCPQFLNMTSTYADRIIGWWQEFGPGFFELRHLVRISAETYAAIEPAVKDGALHINGEAIELDPENSRKLASAVVELRRSLPPRQPSPPPTLEERLTDLDGRCESIVAEFHQLAELKCKGKDKDRLELVLSRASAALQQLEIQLGFLK